MPNPYVFPTEANRPAHIRAVFDRVADRYDLMNDVMSFGMHRRWKHIMAERVLPACGASGVRDILDMASGSGDIALRLLTLAQSRSLRAPLHITLCDPNPDMLAQAQRRLSACEKGATFGTAAQTDADKKGGASFGTAARNGSDQKEADTTREGSASFVQRTPSDSEKRWAGVAPERDASFGTSLREAAAKRVGGRAKEMGGVGGFAPHMQETATSMRLVRAEAEHPPFKAETFDAYTIAFGLRNTTSISETLKAAKRVLRPGGRFFCLEFSQPHLPALAQAYAAYGDHIIPRIGKTIVGDDAPYRYLIESIRRFPPPARITAMLETAGFTRVTCERLSGGIVALHRAWKI